MNHRESSRFRGRQEGSDSSWRLFRNGLPTRTRDLVSSGVVDSFALYSKDVGVDRERLELPADDTYSFRRGMYTSRVMLFGERSGVDEDRLSTLDVQAFADFLEETSQFFGDRITFSVMREVIFLPGSKPTSASEAEGSAVNWRGFTVPSIPGAVFVNSSKMAGYDDIKEVFHHEFSHLIEDSQLRDADDLLEASGWDVRSLDRLDPSWRKTGAVVDSGNYQGDLELSDFAKDRPRETIAELHSDYLGDGRLVSDDSLVRDAMISYLMKRADRPLASNIKRRPIKVRRH